MSEPHPLPPVTGNGEHATVKLSDYLLAIREGDVALQQERDRRYADVAAEREKEGVRLTRDEQFALMSFAVSAVAAATGK